MHLHLAFGTSGTRITIVLTDFPPPVAVISITYLLVPSLYLLGMLLYFWHQRDKVRRQAPDVSPHIDRDPLPPYLVLSLLVSLMLAIAILVYGRGSARGPSAPFPNADITMILVAVNVTWLGLIYLILRLHHSILQCQRILENSFYLRALGKALLAGPVVLLFVSKFLVLVGQYLSVSMIGYCVFAAHLLLSFRNPQLLGLRATKDGSTAQSLLGSPLEQAFLWIAVVYTQATAKMVLHLRQYPWPERELQPAKRWVLARATCAAPTEVTTCQILWWGERRVAAHWAWRFAQAEADSLWTCAHPSSGWMWKWRSTVIRQRYLRILDPDPFLTAGYYVKIAVATVCVLAFTGFVLVQLANNGLLGEARFWLGFLIVLGLLAGIGRLYFARYRTAWIADQWMFAYGLWSQILRNSKADPGPEPPVEFLQHMACLRILERGCRRPGLLTTILLSSPEVKEFFKRTSCSLDRRQIETRLEADIQEWIQLLDGKPR